MIIGTGVDIVEIKRIKDAVDRWGERFLNKIFTPKEIDYAKKKKAFYQRLATRFAAKEAVAKAIGIEGPDFISWKDVEIASDGFGRPSVLLRKTADTIKRRKSIDQIIVSMSHEKKYAIANVVLIKNKK